MGVSPADLLQDWVERRIDEPSPSEIEKLIEDIKRQVVRRRNGRGGQGAVESLVAALRCLYRRAVADGHLTAADDPAAKVAKPRRLPSARSAIADARLAEINEVAATSGDDPELHCLLRLHTETACRRAGRWRYGRRIWIGSNA
ncbi:hypothetical protein ACIA8K_38940 [Catenuloplanes sp. NPDC051500]|uniref:hypothetical protein n=1 Tax=Catenuloplanes sp. NPDC051500 TaxID=3363959 RepID=UPI0037875550